MSCWFEWAQHKTTSATDSLLCLVQHLMTWAFSAYHCSKATSSVLNMWFCVLSYVVLPFAVSPAHTGFLSFWSLCCVQFRVWHQKENILTEVLAISRILIQDSYCSETLTDWQNERKRARDKSAVLIRHIWRSNTSTRAGFEPVSRLWVSVFSITQCLMKRLTIYSLPGQCGFTKVDFLLCVL